VKLGVLAIVTVAGVIFPLVGLTLIAALVIDFVWGRVISSPSGARSPQPGSS
jgi:hypothetical protein